MIATAGACTAPAPGAPDGGAADAGALQLDPAFADGGVRRLADGVPGALASSGGALEVCGVTTRAVGGALQVDALYSQRIATGAPYQIATWPMPPGWTAAARCVATAVAIDGAAVAGFDLGTGTGALLRRGADGTFGAPPRLPEAAPVRDLIALPDGLIVVAFDDATWGLHTDLTVATDYGGAGRSPTFSDAVRTLVVHPGVDPTHDALAVDVVTDQWVAREWLSPDGPSSSGDHGFDTVLPALDVIDAIPLPDRGDLLVADRAGLVVSPDGALRPIDVPGPRPDRAIVDGAGGGYLLAAPPYATYVVVTRIAAAGAGWVATDTQRVAPPDLCRGVPDGTCTDWLVLHDAAWTDDGRLAVLIERRTGDAADPTTPRHGELLVMTR